MGTYLVHVGRKIRARVVRVAVWVRSVLASTLPLSRLLLLLLLLEYLMTLLLLVLLLLVRDGGVWGGIAARGRFRRLAVSSLRMLLGLASGVMRALFSDRCAKSASNSLLSRAGFL